MTIEIFLVSIIDICCIATVVMLALKNYFQFFKKKTENVISDDIDNKYKNIDSNSENLALLMQDKSVEKIYGILDTLIKQAIDRYMIFNANIDKEHYINQKETDEMYKYVLASVKANMSDDMISLLKLINKIDNEKDLENILSPQIKMHLVLLISEQNKPI